MTIERGRTITYSDTLTAECCWVCGTWFGLTQAFIKKRGEDGATFYCPNGDKIRYGTPEVTRLRSQLDQAQADARWQRGARERTERSLIATKGHLTRARKRAAAALCPVPGCTRQIVQMQRHLRTVHPEWEAEHLHAE